MLLLKPIRLGSISRFIHACIAYMRMPSIVLVLILIVQTPLLSSDSAYFESRLRAAIEQTEKELEAERTRIREELKARQDELQRVHAECKEMSDEIVERKIDIARKQGLLRRIRKQREALWTEQTQFQEDLGQLKSICQDVQMELGELLDTLPASEHCQSQRQQLSVLNECLEQNDHEMMVQSVLAGGIGQALITTQAGLWTAVPVLFFQHIIRRRVRLIRNETEVWFHLVQTRFGNRITNGTIELLSGERRVT